MVCQPASLPCSSGISKILLAGQIWLVHCFRKCSFIWTQPYSFSYKIRAAAFTIQRQRWINPSRDHMATKPKYVLTILFCHLRNNTVNPWVTSVHLHTSLSILYICPLYWKSQRALMSLHQSPIPVLRLYGLTYQLSFKVGGFSYPCSCFSVSLLSYFLLWIFCFPVSSTPAHDSIYSLEKAYLDNRWKTTIYMRSKGNQGPYFIHPPSKLLL